MDESQRTEYNNGEKQIEINEYFVGTKTFEEKLLTLMILSASSSKQYKFFSPVDFARQGEKNIV